MAKEINYNGVKSWLSRIQTYSEMKYYIISIKKSAYTKEIVYDIALTKNKNHPLCTKDCGYKCLKKWPAGLLTKDPNLDAKNIVSQVQKYKIERDF